MKFDGRKIFNNFKCSLVKTISGFLVIFLKDSPNGKRIVGSQDKNSLGE